MNKQLQSMSIVPRISLEETKFTEVAGAVQFGLKVVYACAKAIRLQRTTRLRTIIEDGGRQCWQKSGEIYRDLRMTPGISLNVIRSLGKRENPEVCDR